MSSAEEFKTQGNNCMRKQDFLAAIDCYKNGLKEEPKSSVLNCNIAQAYLNLKNYFEAEKFAKKAIELQRNYVKAYYRAARAALGLHNVYDSMLHLAQGVQNCASQDLDDLFNMAKELSEEFEMHLRNFKEKEKSAQAAAVADPIQGTKDVQGKDDGKCKTGNEQETAIQNQDNDFDNKKKKLESEVQERQKKLEQQLEKQKKLEKQLQTQQLLLREYQEGSEAMERDNSELQRELQRLEQVKKQEAKAYQKNARLSQEKEEKELERKIKEQEKKLMAMKEQERRLRENKEREIKEQEQREQEREKERRGQDRVQELERYMKEGSSALLKGLNRKAVDSFKKALDLVYSSSLPESFKICDMDVVVLQYAFSQALIFSEEYNDIVKAIQVLEKLENEKRQSKIPAIFLLLGRAYNRLNRFERAKAPIERGISLLKLRGSSFARFSWPGTMDVIQPTDTTYLSEALERELQTCKMYHKPDAICLYDNCLAINQHLVPSRNIFFSDLDFVGFVEIICQENCHVHFHLICWKDFKEHLSEVEKFGEKDILGRHCLTPDCMVRSSIIQHSVIVKVVIIGSDGEEKSSYECTTPIPPAALVPQKDCVNQALKKKQRKKLEKTEHLNIKRVRHNSKSKRDTPTASAKQGNSDGSEFHSALSKLAAARDQRFGYENEEADLRNVVGATPPCKLGQKEEFVYSYFLEIFKEEGYMSIFNLQQHWETNREHLPALEPAIITHTDLVKFLLDTGGFAVIHDLIGLVSELPNLSTVVESRTDAPLPMAHDWNPSPVTCLEASKTLSFCNISKEVEVKSASDCVEKDPNLQIKNDYSQASNSSSDTERDQLFNLEESDEYLTVLSCSDSNSVSHGNEHNNCGSIRDNCIDSEESLIGRASEHVSNTLSPGGGRDVNEIDERGASENQSGVPSLLYHIRSAEPIQTEKVIREENHASCLGTSEIYHPAEMKQNEASLTLDVHTEHTEIDQQIEAAAEANKRSGWKPRVRIMERVSEKIPGESRERLAEALGIVRALNNSTLSGLTYDVIEERVKFVLQADYFHSASVL